MSWHAGRLLPLLILLILPILGGCGLKTLVFGPDRTDLDALRVIALAGANRDHATRLDVVFVYDAAVAAQLPKTGPEWFRQKTALLAAYADKLRVTAQELPPLSEADPVPLPPRHDKALAVLAYADYLAPDGQPVIQLTPLRRPLLQLGPEAITVSEQTAPAPSSPSPAPQP